MSSKKKSQTSSDWPVGHVIPTKDTVALGGVREQGLAKIAKALPADPELRKKERDRLLTTKQSARYGGAKRQPEEEVFEIESSESGFSSSIHPDSAKKIIKNSDTTFKSATRFGDGKKNKS